MASDEISEVVGYLKHTNPAVAQEACKILTQLCVTPSTFTSLVSLNVIPTLLPLVSTTPPLQTAALTLLVQLSSHDELAASMLSHSTVGICMEQVRTSASSNTAASSLPPLLQLLTNLTRTDKGAALLMQEGTAVETLHIRRLLSLFLQPLHPAIPTDKYAHIASLLLNVSQLPSGQAVADGAAVGLSGCAASTHPLLLRSATARHPHSIPQPLPRAVQPQLACCSLTTAYWRTRCCVIAGEGEVREDEREGFFPSVLARHDCSSRAGQPHSDASIRRLVLEIVTLGARYKPSRLYLKERRVYTVLRELHHEVGEVGRVGQQ